MQWKITVKTKARPRGQGQGLASWLKPRLRPESPELSRPMKPSSDTDRHVQANAKETKFVQGLDSKTTSLQKTNVVQNAF